MSISPGAHDPSALPHRGFRDGEEVQAAPPAGPEFAQSMRASQSRILPSADAGMSTPFFIARISGSR